MSIHLAGIGITGVRRIVPHVEEIIDGTSQYYVHQYRRVKKKQEVDQEPVVGFLLRKYLGVRSGVQMMRLRRRRPMLKSGKNYLNLPHNGDYVVLVSTDIDISVDIEQIEDVHWPTVRKVFILG